jgi:hypothetical protein
VVGCAKWEMNANANNGKIIGIKTQLTKIKIPIIRRREGRIIKIKVKGMKKAGNYV